MAMLINLPTGTMVDGMLISLPITAGGGGGSGTDHHASWEEIVSAATVTIDAYKQMVVLGPFILDGTLLIEGSLIVED